MANRFLIFLFIVFLVSSLFSNTFFPWLRAHQLHQPPYTSDYTTPYSFQDYADKSPGYYEIFNTYIVQNNSSYCNGDATISLYYKGKEIKQLCDIPNNGGCKFAVYPQTSNYSYTLKIKGTALICNQSGNYTETSHCVNLGGHHYCDDLKKKYPGLLVSNQ